MELVIRMGLGVVVAFALSTAAAWVWAQGDDASVSTVPASTQR
jgi:hypothetical protein